jgi:hypothetical protein
MANECPRRTRGAVMRTVRLAFSLDRFWFFALAVLALRVLGGSTGLAAFGLVTLWGLRGGPHVVEAFLLAWFITLANPDVFGEVPGSGVARYILIFSILAAVVWHRLAQRVTRANFAVPATLMLGTFILLHSVFFSAVFTISLLKGLSWTAATAAILVSISSVREAEFERVESHVYWFLALILALSIGVYFAFPGGTMPGYSYLRGMLGHSQATGALGGLVAIWAFARIIAKPKEAGRNFSVLLLAVGTTFLSGTRTGLLSVGFAIVCIGLLASVRGQRPVDKLLASCRSPVVGLGLTVICMSVFFEGDAVFASISDFFRKTEDSDTISEAYIESRGGLIDRMIENIERDPLTGIGFGIASDPHLMQVEYFAGIPISAVVEKGVTPVAVWEELGIFGFLLMVFWASVIFSKAIGAEFAQFGLLAGIFLQNLGEATLFSPGGMGLLHLVLLGYCSYRHMRIAEPPARRMGR